ncbi:MAG: hypothetical protein Q9180_003633 [Flavoplaca navasiana]
MHRTRSRACEALSRNLIPCSTVAKPIQPGYPVACGAEGSVVHTSDFAVISAEAETLSRVVDFDAGVVLEVALVEAGIVVRFNPHLRDFESVQRKDCRLAAIADRALEVVVEEVPSRRTVESLDEIYFCEIVGGYIIQWVFWWEGQGQRVRWHTPHDGEKGSKGDNYGKESTDDHGGVRSDRAANNLEMCSDTLNRKGKPPKNGRDGRLDKG